MLDVSIEAFIEPAKNGDTEAFHRIYAHYVGGLLAFANRMLNVREEAEEVVQEAFFQVYRKLYTLKENQKFEAWLYQVTRNLIHMRYRCRRLQPVSLDSHENVDEQVENQASPEANPEEKLLEEERERAAYAAMHSLPWKLREVFLLSVVQHFSYRQIAEITGRTQSAVKSDVHRARSTVRESIRIRFKLPIRNDEDEV